MEYKFITQEDIDELTTSIATTISLLSPKYTRKDVIYRIQAMFDSAQSVNSEAVGEIIALSLDGTCRTLDWNNEKISKLPVGSKLFTSPQPSEWISVKDRLPEDGCRAWAYIEVVTETGLSHYQSNVAYSPRHGFSDITYGGIVTHWMPLPKAPIDKDKL
jgi:hypothetical protein